MSFLINVYNEKPAYSTRPRQMWAKEITRAFQEIDAYKLIHIESEGETLPLDIRPSNGGIIILKCEHVTFTIEPMPFDMDDTYWYKELEWEAMGDSRKHKKQPRKSPDMTLSMSGDDVQLVIFKDVVGIDTSDPSEIFSDEFLEFLGYQKKGKKVKNYAKKA